jgi:hypothetical protein
MSSLHDAARFHASDPDAVVAASLACPVCLYRPSTVFLPDDDGTASCRCRACDLVWTVSLDLGQSLRMRVAAPPDLLVVKVAAQAMLDQLLDK